LIKRRRACRDTAPWTGGGGAYLALLVGETHVGFPDLEAVAELVETHFLDGHSEVGLQALHHLEEDVTERHFVYLFLTGGEKLPENVGIGTHLPLDVDELSADRVRERGAAVVRDGEEPQRLQVDLPVQGQPGRNPCDEILKRCTSEKRLACAVRAPQSHSGPLRAGPLALQSGAYMQALGPAMILSIGSRSSA